MPSGSNKKTTKNAPNKSSNENSSVITMKKKMKKCWRKSFNHTRKILKKKLSAINELLSKGINELSGKLSDLQGSIEHSDKVDRENLKR